MTFNRACSTDYTLAPARVLTITDRKVIVSYAGKTVEQAITVSPWPEPDVDESVPTGPIPPVMDEAGRVELTLSGPDRKIDEQGNVSEETYQLADDVALQVREAITSGSTSIDLRLGEATASDRVPKINLTIPVTVLAATAAGNDTSLKVSTPTASLTLPPALVQGLAEQGRPLLLQMDRLPADALVGRLPASFQPQNEPVQIVTALQGLTEVTIPTQLALPEDAAERESFLENLRMFALHSDGEQTLISDLQWAIDDAVSPPVLKSVSFLVDKFSSFTLVEVPTQALLTVIGQGGYTFGETWQDMVACYYQGSDTYMPIRMLASFGVELAWDSATRTATLVYLGKSVKLTIGSSAAVINGRVAPIVGASGAHLAPELVKGRTMIPLRFVSEQLGFNVLWKPDQTITVTIR